MKHNVIKYGATVILYALELGEVLTQLSREHLIIFSRNGEAPNNSQYACNENSLLASNSRLAALVLGLRINLQIKSFGKDPITNDLIDSLSGSIKNQLKGKIYTVNLKLINEEFISRVTYPTRFSELEFALGYKRDLSEESSQKITICKGYNISFLKEEWSFYIEENNAFNESDWINILTFTNNKNEYKIIVVEEI